MQQDFQMWENVVKTSKGEEESQLLFLRLPLMFSLRS